MKMKKTEILAAFKADMDAADPLHLEMLDEDRWADVTIEPNPYKDIS